VDTPLPFKKTAVELGSTTEVLMSEQPLPSSLSSAADLLEQARTVERGGDADSP